MKAVDTSVRCSLSKEYLRKRAVPIQYLRSYEILIGLMSVSLFYRYFCNLLRNKKSLTSEKRTILSCQMLYRVRSAHSSIARVNAVPRCAVSLTGTSQKIEYDEKVHFSCNLFQKVKLSYILDSLHVKKTLQKLFVLNFDD